MILGYPLEVLRLRVSSDYALKLCASSLVLHALCDCLHKLKNCCIKSTEAMRHCKCRIASHCFQATMESVLSYSD